MTGMGNSTSTDNPVIVQAFHQALLHQGLIVVGLLVVVLVAWNILRAAQLRRAADTSGLRAAAPASIPGASDDPGSVGVGPDASPPPRPLGGAGTGSAPTGAEPAARRLLRIGFGLLWVLDGVLQGQAAMPNGLIPQVVKPAAQGSPGWVIDLVDDGARIWTYHPVTAAAGAVWIQIGIGLWLIVAPRGNWSRLAGVAAAAWGLQVWIFGEALGGLLAPGLSWLDGAPGAAVLYALAGVAVALPEEYWVGPRLGRILCRVSGSVILALAVLQAWPGRGFWQGQPSPHAPPGSVVSMVEQMAQTPQPALVHSMVADFAALAAAHGWAVNLVVVVAMAALGAGFLAARPRLTRVALAGAAVVCLATWVLVQDLGFFGGVGTDPNSMIPWLLLLGSGYLGLTRPPAAVAPADAPDWGSSEATPAWRQKMTRPAYAVRVVAALAAVATTLIGAAPLAAAATDPNAAPIVAEETDGPVTATDLATPDFHLIDQYGQPVSTRSLQGKAVAVTFLDPVCTNGCPTIAAEFRLADGLLGRRRENVAMVAVDANPQYLAPAFLQAFDRQEGLSGLPNWRYLTGPAATLAQLWKAFGVEVTLEPGGAMVDHSEIAFIIDPQGRIRYVLDTDPGPAGAVNESSFSVTLAAYIEKALRSE